MGFRGNCGGCGHENNVAGAYGGPGYGYGGPVGGAGYGGGCSTGNSFALIVVLFILLIIVGAAWL